MCYYRKAKQGTQKVLKMKNKIKISEGEMQNKIVGRVEWVEERKLWLHWSRMVNPNLLTQINI